MEHRDIDEVIDSKIEIATLSDHAPLTMKMTVPGGQGQHGMWRLNEELIRDKEGYARVGRELEYYFSANDTGEVSGSTLWEAHKAFIRAILIGRKRERTEKTQKLLEEITRAEQEHKKQQGHHQELYQKVVNKRQS